MNIFQALSKLKDDVFPMGFVEDSVFDGCEQIALNMLKHQIQI